MKAWIVSDGELGCVAVRADKRSRARLLFPGERQDWLWVRAIRYPPWDGPEPGDIPGFQGCCRHCGKPCLADDIARLGDDDGPTCKDYEETDHDD